MTTELDPAPADPHDWDRRRTTAVLAAVTLLAVALHLWSTTRVGRPTVSFDETGYLGNARWLAGTGGRWEMPTSPTYTIGYPVLLAPTMWLFDTAAAQWRAVMALNMVLLSTMVPLSFLVARRVLGAGRQHAVFAAALAASVPAVIAAAPSAIAENLALPMVLVTVLAAHRTLTPGPLVRRCWFGPAAAALFAVHGRFLLVVVAAAALLLIARRRTVIDTAVLVTNLVGMAAVASLTWWVSRAVQAARWDHVERLEGGPRELVELLGSWDGVEDVLLAAVGQGWYLLVGSLTLVVAGVAAWLVAARRRDGDGEPARAMVAAFVLVAATSVLLTSVQFFARTQFRADHLVYGRHNDTFMPLWMLGAAVVLLRAAWPSVRRALLLGAGLTLASFVVLTLLRDPAAHGGTYSPFAVPAIARFVRDDPGGTWWRATLVAVVGAAMIGVMVGLLARRRLAVVLVVPWFVVLGLATVEGTDGYETILYEHFEAPELLTRLGVDSLSIDSSAVEVAFPVLSYASQLPQLDVSTYDPREGDEPGGPFVLARLGDATMRSTGARIVTIDNSGITRYRGAPEGVALWVRPGPELDRLERRGHLLPPAFPAPLPDAARAVELELDEPSPLVRLRAGDQTHVRVRGVHAGSGSPWPDGRNLDGPARVRIAARGDGSAGAADPVVGAELPNWALPGDAFVVDVGVVATGADGEPLAPGRYEIQLGVTQDDPGWFGSGGPAAAFTLEVVG